MMRETLGICAGFLALSALAQAPIFDPRPPAWQAALAAGKDAAAGAAIACAGCHGAEGIPVAGTPFPRLAGLPVEYVAKQLFDYRDGTRANDIMAPIAKALTDSDIASLAPHYASLPVASIATASQTSARGLQLARYGDNVLALPACIDCHGSNAAGGGPVLPPLGQPSAYTSAQLEAFRSGARGNDTDRVMREFAKRLSDTDIQALAAYYGAE
jgi:cytochrome c553